MTKADKSCGKKDGSKCAGCAVHKKKLFLRDITNVDLSKMKLIKLGKDSPTGIAVTNRIHRPSGKDAVGD